MNTSISRGFGLFVGGVIVLGAIACNGSTKGGGGSCGSYFDSYSAFVTRCEPAFASQENRDRFIEACQLQLNAPGASGVDNYLTSCGNGLANSNCDLSTDPCGTTPVGTLATGAACGTDLQCATAFCKGAGVSSTSTSSGSGGTTTTTTATCGICGPLIPIGQPCDQTKGDRCADSGVCNTVNNVGTCIAVASNDVGGPCGTTGTTCKTALTCNFMTMKCVAPQQAGGTCSISSDCVRPLTCISNQCGQGKAAGEACTTDPKTFQSDCASDTQCDSVSKTCKGYTFAAPGAQCDQQFILCAHGSCNVSDSMQSSTMGTCPTVIPDGQPCDPSSKSTTCDEYADCINKVCTIFDPSSCK